MFPNPASDVLYLKNLPSQTAEYAIFNVMGQQVKKGSTNGAVSVAGLGSGLYLMQIEGENFRNTAKFIVE